MQITVEDTNRLFDTTDAAGSLELPSMARVCWPSEVLIFPGVKRSVHNLSNVFHLALTAVWLFLPSTARQESTTEEEV